MIAFFLRLFTSLWLLIVIVVLARNGSCSTFYLSTDTRGARFWKDYTFVQSDAVEGINMATYALMNDAFSTGLAELGQEDPFALKLSVDNTTTNPPFRNSVKLQSNYAYGDGVYVLDLNHFPSGCGVRPAFWTKTANSSSSQEIDIIQNVNGLKEGPIIALHTDQQCQPEIIPASMTGTFGDQMNCQQKNNNVSGCVGYYKNLKREPAKIKGGTTNLDPQRRSIDQSGSSFGQSGRTIVVMQRDLQNSHGISAWTFTNEEIPSNLNQTLSIAGNGNGQINRSVSISIGNWPSPNVLFSLPLTTCKEQWQRHFLVINIALCGNWATNTYNSSGCGAQFGSCTNQVASQIASFDNAFWSINSITIFASNNFNFNPSLLPELSSAKALYSFSFQIQTLSFIFTTFILLKLL